MTISLFQPPKPVTPEKAAFSDPAFASNKTLPIHRWVPWIAGFASEFVRGTLQRLEAPGVVLDPFTGVGTTLVEASFAGHEVIGFEINPYAALASRAKLFAVDVDTLALLREICRFEDFCEARSSGYTPLSAPPPGFATRAAFYSPDVLQKVLTVQDFIATLPEGATRDLFRVAFAATMVRYSNYSYEPSLGQRVSAGKSIIEDYAVAHTVAAKLREIAQDIAWLHANAILKSVTGRVIQDTFFRYTDYLQPQTVDLIVTSPPYLNNYHYNRNTRPQLYWLGYAESPKDLVPLEQGNFGKYWQTVRDLPRLDLEFALPGTDIVERIETLRGLNSEKKVYGGHGWANYAASYFNDCRHLAQGIHYSLKRGGTALVVIGNSILQGEMIPTDEYFGKIAESVGLELVNIEIPRATRVGNSIIQSTVRVTKASPKHQLYEAMVELRRR